MMPIASADKIELQFCIDGYSLHFPHLSAGPGCFLLAPKVQRAELLAA